MDPTDPPDGLTPLQRVQHLQEKMQQGDEEEI
jgi:hypothetical protein